MQALRMMLYSLISKPEGLPNSMGEAVMMNGGIVLLVEGSNLNDAVIHVCPRGHVPSEQVDGLIPWPWIGIGEITPAVVQMNLNLVHSEKVSLVEW